MTIDPVCGMEVDELVTPVVLKHRYEGTEYSFCSQDCCDEFVSSPEDYLDGMEEEA